MSANVVDFDQKIAATLASEPKLVLEQMRQHREVVAGLREENRALKAETERQRRRIDQLVASLSAYECGCGVSAETIEDHDCRDTDPADREEYVTR